MKTLTAEQEAFLEALGSRLDDLMATRALTQADVFLRSHGRVRPETVSRVLRGYDHKLSTLIDIADALGCSISIDLRQ